MSKLTADEIAKFENCKNETEWNSLCDEVKNKRNGSYPADWWMEMKLTGRMDRILNSFGSSSDLKISTFDKNSGAWVSEDKKSVPDVEFYGIEHLSESQITAAISFCEDPLNLGSFVGVLKGEKNLFLIHDNGCYLSFNTWNETEHCWDEVFEEDLTSGSMYNAVSDDAEYNEVIVQMDKRAKARFEE